MSNAFAMAGLPPKSQRTYSTTEQWTGEWWHNNKKIYRKTYAGKTEKDNVLLDTLPLETLITFEAQMANDRYQYLPAPGGFINNQMSFQNQYIGGIAYDSTNNGLYFYVTRGYVPTGVTHYNVTVYYTKRSVQNDDYQ